MHIVLSNHDSLKKIVSYFHLVVHLFYDINYMLNLYNFGVLQDSLVEQKAQGSFVPRGCHDIMHEAIA